MKMNLIIFTLLILVGYSIFKNTSLGDYEIILGNSIEETNSFHDEELGFGEKDKRPEIIEISVESKDTQSSINIERQPNCSTNM